MEQAAITSLLRGTTGLMGSVIIYMNSINAFHVYDIGIQKEEDRI